ncbi:hypothetical protein B0T18DRAFT_400367 [Schizothecium vesticola]|uniref:Uncharacterized protein n=1 Tax=Schizothecium vesticola TaxID=314040 RepID=A0AA40KDI6_9PEZI|nr:hypothetical protein B0T18DRAFT_400367 [Schizothecium vesticola]
MSASSLRLARTIPPSLPLRNRLPTRPPPPFFSILCCAPTPFHRTPVLLQSEFGRSMHKKQGSRKTPAFGRLPQQEQWTGQENSANGHTFKNLDLRGDGKASLEVEGASRADDNEPTVVDWGVLAEAPAERTEHPPTLTVREQRSVDRKKKKVERLMASLAKMNAENWQFKSAKRGVTLDKATDDSERRDETLGEAADDSESPSPPPSEVPSYEEALSKVQSLVELRPCIDNREKKIQAYLRLWKKQGTKVPEPSHQLSSYESQLLATYEIKYKAEFSRIQALLKVTPGSDEHMEEIEAHMQVWEDAYKRKKLREPRPLRRFKELYAKELAKIQSKFNVMPGSDEHKDEIETYMQKWEKARKSLEERMEERRKMRGQVSAEKRRAKIAAKRERKKQADS